MVGALGAVALRVDVVVVRDRIRREHYVWVAIHSAMARVGAGTDVGGAGLFLAIELLGECLEFAVCAPPRQRAFAAGCGGVAFYLRKEFGFVAPWQRTKKWQVGGSGDGKTCAGLDPA